MDEREKRGDRERRAAELLDQSLDAHGRGEAPDLERFPEKHEDLRDLLEMPPVSAAPNGQMSCPAET